MDHHIAPDFNQTGMTRRRFLWLSSMAAAGFVGRKLISPDDGNAALLCCTSADRGKPVRPINSHTNSHGIIPLSQ